jgi:hypothetical protein
MKGVKKAFFLFFSVFVLFLSFFNSKNIIAQAPSSTLTFEIKLNPGWNWVSFPLTDPQIDYKNSDCYFLYPYAQYFNSSIQRFSNIYIKTANNLGGLGFRLYSFDKCTLNVTGRGKYQPSEIDLKKGNNLVAIPYGGIDLAKLRGCKINFIRYYNSSDHRWYQWEAEWGKGIIYLTYNMTSRKWEKIKEFESFILPAGISILINVNDDCKLSFELITTTTTLPHTTTTTTGGGRDGGNQPMG